jgi:hypothetical protein
MAQEKHLTATADERKAKLEERRTNVINRIRALEAEPVGAQADAHRTWLLSWRPEDLGITVRVCGDLVENKVAKHNMSANVLFVSQFGFSAARFMLENPKQVKDEKAINVAGLEGLLSVYARLSESDMSLRDKNFDELLKRRDAGKLREYVGGVLSRGCRERKLLAPIL